VIQWQIWSELSYLVTWPGMRTLMSAIWETANGISTWS
jgi:hypothetical protein